MDASPEHAPVAPVGWRDTSLVFTAPVKLFSRVEDTGAYGLPLAILLVLTTLIGFAQVQTGLIDRVVDQQTESQLAELEKQQKDLVDRTALKDAMEGVRKNGTFVKLLRRLGAVVLTPVYMLVSFLLISAILYAAVALTGRKPEYHTLMSICVFAGFIELVGLLVHLGMMLVYRTTRVDTSLAMLADPAKPSPLVAIDPFRIWFWVLVTTGVIVTQQLTRRAALITCSICFLIASGGWIGFEYLSK